jgi:organic radical activating enzyme
MICKNNTGIPVSASRGGEPVLRADFLSVLIPELKSRGLAVHLETSATHPSLFRKIAGFCDVVAADVKLPSAIGRDCWEEHRAFLEMAGDRAFVKVVLTSATTDGEMARVVELLAGLNPVPPLILQPVTALPPLESRRAGTPGAAAQFVRPPTADRVGDFFKTTRARLPRVVVIPQMHPVWGVP